MDKQAIWDAIADRWDPDQEEHDIFFGDRLVFDIESVDELGGVNITEIIQELRDRPSLRVTLFRWGATLSSPVANDIHKQDHYPPWVNAGVENCNREEDNGTHNATWALA